MSAISTNFNPFPIKIHYLFVYAKITMPDKIKNKIRKPIRAQAQNCFVEAEKNDKASTSLLCKMFEIKSSNTKRHE